MAGNAAKQAGRGLKTKKPQCGNTGASGNEINFGEEIVMNDVSTVVDMRKFVEARNGEAFTSSQNVAAAFGKLHKDVLRKIDGLECSTEFTERNFTLSAYVDGSGRSLPQWDMTKDGFMFLVMGFTGKKSAATKEAYIAAFNWMADQLGLSSETLVAKAVNEALGAEGARTIRNVIRCRIASLPTKNQRSAKMKMSSALHARFSVPRIELIPADQLDAACNFVASYGIEGEYIQRQAHLLPEKLGQDERYLVSADPLGNKQVMPVPMDAYVLNRREFMKSMLVDEDMPVSTEEMFQFVAWATENLRRRSLYQASRRAAA